MNRLVLFILGTVFVFVIPLALLVASDGAFLPLKVGLSVASLIVGMICYYWLVDKPCFWLWPVLS